MPIKSHRSLISSEFTQIAGPRIKYMPCNAGVHLIDGAKPTCSKVGI